MSYKGSDGSGTGDSGYFSRRLPRGTYSSSNYPSNDRENSTGSLTGSLRSRLSDDLRPHSPLRRSDALSGSYRSPTASRDGSLKSNYSSPYSSLTSEPSLSRTSSSPYTRSTSGTYTSPYSSGGDTARTPSSYLRTDPGQYRSEDRGRDQPTTGVGYSSYPEGYSSLGRRRIPSRLTEEPTLGSTAFERMEPSFVRRSGPSFERDYGDSGLDPRLLDEGLGGYTSLPFVYELSDTMPVLVESPRMRIFADNPLVDYPVDRRDLNRTYSELAQPRSGDSESATGANPIMRKRGTYHGGEGGDTRADRIRQRYGTGDSPPIREYGDDYPGSLREYPGSAGRSLPRRFHEEMSDTLRSNLSDPGVTTGTDHSLLPGVPLPPNKPPPSYQDVLGEYGKRYTPLGRGNSESDRNSPTGSAISGTGSVRSGTESQSGQSDLQRMNSGLEERYRSPTGTGTKKNFQQARSASRDEQGDAGKRRDYGNSRSNSRGSFDEDQGGRRVKFGGFFDDFDRPSLFGRRGRSLFDAFDIGDEREKRRAKFRDMFDDRLGLLGRHHDLFGDWHPFNRSRSGSPLQRSSSGSPRPGSSASQTETPRCDSPRSSKTTLISETSDPQKGKKVVEITETTSPTTGRKKRTIKETKMSSLDAGDGTKRTVTETKTETIEPNEKDKVETVPNEQSWKPIDKRNLFDKYRFNFGSFGQFGSGKSPGKETLNFRDFDDLVEKFQNLHQISRADIQKEEKQEKDEQEDDREEPEKGKAEDEKETNVQDIKKESSGNPNQKVEKEEKNKQIKVEQTSEEQSKNHPADDGGNGTRDDAEKPDDCQYTCHHKCRQLVSLDCASLPDDEKKKLSETTLTGSKPKLDDADSGYHTGESTLQATPAPAPHVPSERTLTREDLRRRIDAFNNNQHGLLMTLNEEVLTFQGFIRVHMNLMRPISMVLPMRPPSIYDVISSDGEGSDDGGEGVDQDTLTTSFYLPKDTSKVIHITSSTTTSEVIRALLQKFKITDNPRKFALYEKIIDGDKPSMRRMVDDERPLPLCLSWSCEGLDSRKFVLQENDTGEIIWDEFSIPELENFLRILDREEEEYVEQVKARYTLLRIQMQKEMNAIAEEEKEKELFDKPEDKPPDPSSDDGSSSDKNLQPDNREPVFV